MENKITYKVEKRKEGYDHQNVTFYVDGDEVRTGAYRGLNDDTICLVRCPSCGAENYGIMVATGKCAWCTFDATQAEEEK